MSRHVARTRSYPALLAAALLVAALVVLAAPASTASAQTEPLQEEPFSTTAVAFTGTANSANARFVVDVYQQLLGRTADTAGLDFHLDRLTSGGDRTRFAVTYAMLFSTEGSGQEVGRAYGDLLNRGADATGGQYWTDHLQGHDVLDLRVLLMASDEYRARAGGTDTAWIESLYSDVLGRGSDPGGLQYWQSLATAGTARPLIVAGIYLSDEALGRRVDAYYAEALSRAPSAAERSAGITDIRSGGERQLRARIWASDEAFERYLDAAVS